MHIAHSGFTQNKPVNLRSDVDLCAVIVMPWLALMFLNGLVLFCSRWKLLWQDPEERRPLWGIPPIQPLNASKRGKQPKSICSLCIVGRNNKVYLGVYCFLVHSHGTCWQGLGILDASHQNA